jgi:hypothetical protein
MTTESHLRVFLFICAGVAISSIIGWGLDKVWPKSKWRDALLTGAGIYLALTLDSLLMK